MYGKCQDKEKMARLYALYIARGELPEDARYVDRLRWMLSTVKTQRRQRGAIASDPAPAHGQAQGQILL